MVLDFTRKLYIKKGCVPPTCEMPGDIIKMLIEDLGDPCIGCETNREVCKGRPKERQINHEQFIVGNDMLCFKNNMYYPESTT